MVHLHAAGTSMLLWKEDMTEIELVGGYADQPQTRRASNEFQIGHVIQQTWQQSLVEFP